jgi:excinuclease ABC subunit A
VFDHVRKLFAQTTEAKVRGYLPGRFSFNVKGGRCEACSGDGTIKIEMNFLPDVYVPCEVCHGARYNRETLEVHFKGKTISDVLDMPIEEAAGFFSAVPAISRHLTTLVEVGLGYVRLGQPATTLSGGEAQRVKLASELQKRSTGRTVYVLDEPTTGLHFEDIRKLLQVLQGLVDKGNTVLVIEHNLDVIKSADWVVDMGPEGGSGGGLVVATGTPEQVAAHEGSHTGAFLAPVLAAARPVPTGPAVTVAAARATTRSVTTATTAKGAAGAAPKGPAAKGSATKGTAAKAAALANGAAARGSAVKGTAARGTAAKGSAAKGSAVKGAAAKGATGRDTAAQGTARGAAGKRTGAGQPAANGAMRKVALPTSTGRTAATNAANGAGTGAARSGARAAAGRSAS